MSFTSMIIKRSICTTAACQGKRNFRKFPLYGKRGTKAFKEAQMKNPDPDIPIDKRGMRDVGYLMDGKMIRVQEMIPDIIVPELTDFKLKPYVSYRAPDISQSEFTAEDLFHSVYAEKISKDFDENKLNEDGSPIEPSNDEKLTAEEAFLKARQTGSDIF